MSFGVALFHTTAMTMKAEKALAREGFSTTLIPTPRQFSSDCGIALRFSWAHRENVRAALEKAGVEIAAIHEFTGR